MTLGWVFGRHLIRHAAGLSEVSGKKVLWWCGVAALITFVVVRGLNGYGNMFLPRADGSWQQWLHVSKYPPSLTYAALELGILFLCLAFLRTIEPEIGVRENGPFLVFGQTAMFFYLVHRLAFEIPATYLRTAGRGWTGHDLGRRARDARGDVSRLPLVPHLQGGSSEFDSEVLVGRPPVVTHVSACGVEDRTGAASAKRFAQRPASAGFE